MQAMDRKTYRKTEQTVGRGKLCMCACACAYLFGGDTNHVLAVSIIVLLSPGEVEGITIPREWKELLRLVCQENENAICSQPIVRDVLTFPSAAALLCQSTNVSH